MTDHSNLTEGSSPTVQPVRILGIESSCDETAAAVVESGRVIHSSVVASQVDLHARYGGVFPEVASRQHIRAVYAVVEQALQDAHLALADVDGIAVTRGPGLPGSLVVGMNMAKGLALASKTPLVGVNHLEGHLYSAWLIPPEDDGETEASDVPAPQFPLLALLVSGGHTELILMRDHLCYERLGGTLDDASGEAFDKVGRLLGLSYPGGPAIQKASENGNPEAFAFPRARLAGTWNFSFSGLKTAVLREVRRIEGDNLRIDKDAEEEQSSRLPAEDMAASFQESVVDVLFSKTMLAARHFSVREILIAGGVSANKALRETFLAQTEFPVHIPPISLCTDNAAMIAAAGFYRFRGGQRDELDIDVLPNWPLT